MTTAERIARIVERLPLEKREDFEVALSDMVQNFLSDANDVTLSPEQEAEDLRRFSDPNRQFATREQVDAVWGKPLPH